ncbi:MAG: Ig-like domain repeat protein [Clostridiales bacterium]|nr:Ig-like domain repeat protein [Clostridiales bacterium]
MKGKNLKKEVTALVASLILFICTILCNYSEAAMSVKAETVDATSEGSIDVTSGGSIEVTSGGSIEVTSGGSIEVTSGGSIEVTSGGSIEVIEPVASFMITSPGSISFNPNSNTYENLVISSITPSSIHYSIISGESIASIDSNTGIVTINSPGTITVNACVSYANHEAINIQYSLEIDKAEQSNFAFNQDTYTVFYGQKNVKITPTGNAEGSTITYSLDRDDFISIDQDGNLTFLKQNSGNVTLTAHSSGNSYYKDADASCIIKVEIWPTPEKSYRMEGNYCSDFYREDNVAWYSDNVKLIPKEGYLIGLSNQLDDNQWSEYIELSDEGKNQTDFYLRNTSNGAITPKISSPDVFIDKSNPIILDVSYTKPFFPFLTYWFFRDNVCINVKAQDTVSTIKQIQYEYKIDDKNFKAIIDNSCATYYMNGMQTFVDTNIKLTYSEDGKTAYCRFILEKAINSNIKFVAVDYAGRDNQTKSEHTVVIDSEAPIITTVYDNNENFNDIYYNKTRTATIKIEEDNFYQEDIVAKVSYRKNANEEYQTSEVKPSFSKKKGNVHATEIQFNEDGEYQLEVSYTDKSGNTAEPFKDHFIIDTITPEVTLNFTQNCNKNDFFSDSVETSISITDEFFDINNLTYVVSAKDFTNTAFDLSELKKSIKNEENWSEAGNTYTFKTNLDYEGEVALSFSYSDKANNKAQDNRTFYIDKQKPTNLKIEYSNPNKTIKQSDHDYLYYNEDVKVTISGIDNGGGVDVLEYQLIDEENHTVETVTVDKKDIIYSEDGTKAEYQFKISKDFKGKIELHVIDKAGNKSTYQDNRILILDKVAPVISVNFSDDNSKEFYNTARKATISITELNFNASDVRISIKYDNTDASGQAYTISAFTDYGTTHSCVVDFSYDGEYVLEVSYTDNSGNRGNSYVGNKFCIDRKAPVVSVSYDNNEVYNDYCFNAPRNATITVYEKNFSNGQFIANIVLKDIDGKTIIDESIQQQLYSQNAWIDSGDYHTIHLNFAKEGIYEVSFSCNDKAGNSNFGIDFCSSVAVNKFFIDKTKPTGSIKISQFNKTWNQLLFTHNFNLYSNKIVEVELVGQDTLTGIGDIAYYKSDTTLSEEQLKQVTNWQVIDTNKFYFVEQDKFIIYGRIRDKVNNTTYISSDGMIIDYEAPSFEKVAPSIQLTPDNHNTTDIYNDDVGIDVNIKDVVVANEVYSGIRIVSYEVFNLGEMTQSGILYGYQEVTNVDQIPLKEWAKTNAIIVDKVKNNSNEVEVRVKAIDYSGNVSTKSIQLKIDITEPEIEVVYDNNQQDAILGNYFKENRTATITVRERNFDPSLVQIMVKNIDGSQVPNLSEWKKYNGSHNLDDTTYVATIKYQENGHYQFEMSMIDMAANKNTEIQYMNSVCTNDFILDKTIPQIELLYDNNNALNQNYYKENRTITVVITEHNFDASRVDFFANLTKYDKTLQQLQLGSWSSNGDTHTATVKCSEDGFYQLRCEFTDKAGNKVADAVETKFYVDQTKPNLAIEGVENLSANRGSVAPIITYSDFNLDYETVTIQLIGQRRGEVELNAAQTDLLNGKRIELKDFEKTLKNDDYYTLTVTLKDKAGNVSTKSIEFSINRFGSTYKLSNSASQMNGNFVYDEKDIILSEVNVDPLNTMEVILYKNNQTVSLVNGVDYFVSQKNNNANSYIYEYVISKDNFKEDGVYRIVIKSTDKAGNVSLSNTEEKNLEISFGIDKTKPIIIVSNLESDKTYSAKQLNVNFSVTDNLKVETIQVKLDQNDLVKWDKPAEEEFECMIPGDSTKPHTLQITVTDAAGNSTVEEISGFYVTTNKWVQYRNNKGLFYGSIGGFGALSAGTVAVFSIRRKKLRKRVNS